MKSDQELKETYKLYIDNDGILNLNFFSPEIDENNTRQCELVKEEVLAILNADPSRKFVALVDISWLESQGTVSPKSQTMYIELAKNPQIKKIAVVGITDVASNVLKFVLFMMKLVTRKMGWFPNKDEAIAWLKS